MHPTRMSRVIFYSLCCGAALGATSAAKLCFCKGLGLPIAKMNGEWNHWWMLNRQESLLSWYKRWDVMHESHSTGRISASWIKTMNLPSVFHVCFSWICPIFIMARLNDHGGFYVTTDVVSNKQISFFSFNLFHRWRVQMLSRLGQNKQHVAWSCTTVSRYSIIRILLHSSSHSTHSCA